MLLVLACVREGVMIEMQHSSTDSSFSPEPGSDGGKRDKSYLKRHFMNTVHARVVNIMNKSITFARLKGQRAFPALLHYPLHCIACSLVSSLFCCFSTVPCMFAMESERNGISVPSMSCTYGSIDNKVDFDFLNTTPHQHSVPS